MTRHTVVASPIGPLLLVAEQDALTGLYVDGHERAPSTDLLGPRDPGPFRRVSDELSAYFAGELTDFSVPVDPRGTPFQERVWAALRDIDYGSTTTYGRLATRLGRPTAARAVGLANGRNPISIVIPCHRVIGASGDLTGYGWGLDAKRRLLDLEAAHS